MLVIVPAKRYNIVQVTQHRWFTHSADYDEHMKQIVRESVAVRVFITTITSKILFFLGPSDG